MSDFVFWSCPDEIETSDAIVAVAGVDRAFGDPAARERIAVAVTSGGTLARAFLDAEQADALIESLTNARAALQPPTP
ncbi:hypothetical protein [Nocardia puris]|uniref:hypothetical protein n=1 Tax=Nocardia puris TaxID=208602 RepID=UPI002E1AF5A9